MAVGDKYRALHQRSLNDPEGFWAERPPRIDWSKRWDKVLDAPSRRSIAGSPAPSSTPATTRSTAMSSAAAPSRRR